MFNTERQRESQRERERDRETQTEIQRQREETETHVKSRSCVYSYIQLVSKLPVNHVGHIKAMSTEQ